MPKTEPRLYVILREDLSYKYVQGQHAVAQYALEHPASLKDWDNKYLIDLSVFNGLALNELLNELKADICLGPSESYELSGDECYSVFYEPDLQSPLPTAIAIYENGEGRVAKFLSKCKLATK